MDTSNSQLGNFFIGLGKLLLSTMIFLLSALIFYSSLKYIDPNFKGGYLSGRGSSSVELVRVALLLHAFSATSITWLMTPSIFFRTVRSWQRFHVLTGRTSAYMGFFILLPSGIILSYYAMGGTEGKILFLVLTMFSAVCLFFGFRTARLQEFLLHRIWMSRFYILLTSAIWLRIFMFITIFRSGTMDENQYLICALMSWVPQIIVFEIFLKIKRGLSSPFRYF